jgi:hypothetical protein
MSTPRRPLFSLQRLVISVLLAGAIVTLVVAFTLHQDKEPLRLTHDAVRVVSPAPGEQSVPQQRTVFVELTADYSLDALQINSQAVGGDELEHIPGLNRWSFNPGEGKSMRQLPGGRICAVAEFHRVGTTGEPERFPWCFFVS